MNKFIKYNSSYVNFYSLNNLSYIVYFIGLIFILIFNFNPTSKTYFLIDYLSISIAIFYFIFAFTFLIFIFIKALKTFKSFYIKNNQLFIDYDKFMKSYKINFVIKIFVLIIFAIIFLFLKFLVSINNNFLTPTILLYFLLIILFGVFNRLLNIHNEKYTNFNQNEIEINKITIFLNINDISSPYIENKSFKRKLTSIFSSFFLFNILLSIFIVQNIYYFNNYSYVLLIFGLIFLLIYVYKIIKLSSSYHLFNKSFIFLSIFEIILFIISNIPLLYLIFNKDLLLEDKTLTYLLSFSYVLLLMLIYAFFSIIKSNDLMLIKKTIK